MGRSGGRADSSRARQKAGWTSLYAILAIGAGLCAIGVPLAAATGRPALLQLALVVILLVLLRTWVLANRSALGTREPDASPTPRLSVIRIPLSKQPRVVQPPPQLTHSIHPPVIRPPRVTSTPR